MPNHYEVLGVDPASEQEVIEAAYKALIRKYHPDRAGDNQRIRDINAAYAVLKSPVKRGAYDAKLKLFPSRELARAVDVPVRPAPGPKPRAGQPKAAPSEPLKTCPECHADVRRSAKRCRHCGFQFWSGILGTQSRDIGCASVVILLLVLMLMYCSGPGATGDAVTDTGNQAETTGEASIPGPFQGVWGLSQQECGRGITTKTVTANDIDGGKVVKVEELSDQQIKVEYEFTEGRFVETWTLGDGTLAIDRPGEDYTLERCPQGQQSGTAQGAASPPGPRNAALAAAGRAALDADWTFATTVNGPDGNVDLYVNLAAMARNGAVATTWVKGVNADTVEFGDHGREMPGPFTLFKFQMDCDARTVAVPMIGNFAADGRLLAEIPMNGGAEPFSSVGAADGLVALCGSRGE